MPTDTVINSPIFSLISFFIFSIILYGPSNRGLVKVISIKTSSIENSSTSGEKFWHIFKNCLEISKYLTKLARARFRDGQILNASYVRAPVLIPNLFASRLEAIIQV